uniref:Carbonic anhydrase n=1 Tax=Parastrongyloides trichosuri TaxID=131310 RepID=A0A0N4Z3L9_PARTI
MLYTSLLIFSLIISIYSDGADYKWGYTAEDGPATWRGHCKDGIHQSPIDISGENVIITHMPRLHFIKYNHKGKIELSNTGASILGKGFENWKNHTPYITGGGLSAKYYLAQWHIHWAQTNDDGSEHTMGKLHYPAEIHFVHVKEGLDIKAALEEHDGLAVVGAFFVVDKNGNRSHGFSDIEMNAGSITEKGQSVTIESHRARGILPRSVDSFYRYEGSLTTPGCNEAVVWTVLDNPIVISQEQMDALRKLKTVVSNNRPTQPLNGRKIYYKPHNIQSFLTEYILQGPKDSGAPFISFNIITLIFSICSILLFFHF